MWQEIGCDLAPLQYLKRWKSLSQMTTLPTTDYAGKVAQLLGYYLNY